MKRPAPRFTVEHRQLAPRKRKAKPPRPKRAAIRQALDLARPLEGAPWLAAPSCLTTTTKRDAAE